MIRLLRREGDSLRALIHDHYPTPGTWTETAYWLAVGLHTRARHLLHPLTAEERAAASLELLTGTPDEAGAMIDPPTPPDANGENGTQNGGEV